MLKYLLASTHLKSDDTFSLGIARRQPQPDTPPHTHDFCELVLVTHGAARHVTEDGVFPIHAGDVFIVHNDRVHGYEQTSGFGLINIIFRPDFLKMLDLDVRQMAGFHVLMSLEPDYRGRHRFASRLHLPPLELQRVLAWVEVMDDELTAERPGYRFNVRAWFMAIVGYLCRFYEQRAPHNAQPLFRIGAALAHLEENCEAALSVESLAKVAGMSVSSLYRAFNETVGMPPLMYQQHLRLSRACHLLRNSDLAIGEIALRVGYADTNYFSRQFRRHVGATPSAFRRGTRSADL